MIVAGADVLSYDTSVFAAGVIELMLPVPLPYKIALVGNVVVPVPPFDVLNGSVKLMLGGMTKDIITRISRDRSKPYGLCRYTPRR